jgi:hypothetical protein
MVLNSLILREGNALRQTIAIIYLLAAYCLRDMLSSLIGS